MSTILIVESGKAPKEYVLEKTLTTLGASEDYDIIIDSLGEAVISILREADGLKAIPIEQKSFKTKGKWNKLVNEPANLSLGDVNIFLLPKNNQNQNQKDGQVSDWDFADFPTNPKLKNYPEKILKFILKSIKAEQGGLFYKTKDYVSVLASQNLNIKFEAEHFLNQYIDTIDTNGNAPFRRVNFETHSTLFTVGLAPCNFLLISSNLLDDEKVVLYIPETDAGDSGNFPEGILQTILYLLTQGLSLHLVYKYNERLKRQQVEQFKEGFFWGKNPKMQRVKMMADKLAITDLSLLILGETGSGKEILAKYLAQKTNSKMVALNCAAIPKELAESMLFGHMKGAFTHAIKDQKGKIEEANGGILFLDEIGELSSEIQGKLLRFLEDGIVCPVGGREFKCKVRIFAATHENLKELVKLGQFREDLYFRLSEATLNILPLRERREDLMSFAQGLLTDFIKKNGIEEKSFGPAIESLLLRYSWPGNVRELRSLIRRCVVLMDGDVITAEDLSSFMEREDSTDIAKGFMSYPVDLQQAKNQFIKEHIEKILAKTNGNKTQASKLMGISARSLFRMMASFDQDIFNMDSDKGDIHSTVTS